jgi:hypothetical protein
MLSARHAGRARSGRLNPGEGATLRSPGAECLRSLLAVFIVAIAGLVSLWMVPVFGPAIFIVAVVAAVALSIRLIDRLET